MYDNKKLIESFDNNFNQFFISSYISILLLLMHCQNT